MENLKWEIIETEILVDDSQFYKTYGVNVADLKGFEFTYSDVSLSRKDVQRLVDRVGKMDISTVHLRDIVLDYIEELAGVDIYSFNNPSSSKVLLKA
jgi:hypothetical protein